MEVAILEKTLDLEVVSSDENHIVVNLYDDGVLVNQSFMEPLQTTPQKPVYSPPKAQTGYSPKPLHQNVQEQTHNSIGKFFFFCIFCSKCLTFVIIVDVLNFLCV